MYFFRSGHILNTTSYIKTPEVKLEKVQKWKKQMDKFLQAYSSVYVREHHNWEF